MKKLSMLVLAFFLSSVSLASFAASSASDSAQQHRECTQTCLSQHTKDREYCQKQDSQQAQSCLADRQRDYEQCKNQCDKKY